MFQLLVILFMGGVGTFGGPVLGALIYKFLPEIFHTFGTAGRAKEEIDYLIFGAMLVLVIVFMPQGVYPRLRSILKYWISQGARRLKRWGLVSAAKQFRQS